MPSRGPAESLRARILERIAQDSGAIVAVAVRDPVGEFTVLVNPDLQFHAASTMKVPVLVELARRVDGSAFSLDSARDSDPTVYAAIGTAWPLGQLATRRIVRSSNLATNLLIERLDATRVTRTMRRLGADSMVVLRGVEDGKAFEKGLINTTPAGDLGTLFLAIAAGRAASKAGTAEVLGIMEQQEFNDGIPARLPPGTRVAHKTGEITATWHDAALIYPPDGRPYALVVLTRGVPLRDRGVALQADIARLVHPAVLELRRRGRTP